MVSLLRTSGETVKAEFSAGPFEVGEVLVHDGQAWHAEVPGTRGFAALQLLTRLPSCLVIFRDSAPGERSISPQHQPPLDVLSDELRQAMTRARAAGRLSVGDLEQVSRRSVSDLSLPPDAVPTTSGEFSLNATSPEERAAVERFEVLFRQGTQAYLRHDFKTALDVFEECLRLRPSDRRVLHNLERLRNRTT